MTCTDVKRMHGKVGMPAKPRSGRIFICVLLAVLLVCAAVMISLHLHNANVEQQRIELETTQNEFVQELQDNEGRYDAQSIVLNHTSEPVARKLAEKLGAKLRITEDGSFATLTLPEGITILDVAMSKEYLVDLPNMSADYEARISEMFYEEESDNDERLPVSPQYTVNDTLYNRQTYLDYLNMQDAWNWSQGSEITVAVIDTGIDHDHPEFAGRISEYSYNATEDKIVKDYVLENGEYDWSLVEDEQGHGTAVTGVIAAAMDGTGTVGIAPNVTIITIKAECDVNGTFERTSDLVFALYYAIERDVNVVNMSFGTYEIFNPFAEATQLAYDSDVICVAAAGNNSTAELSWPAADPLVIGVGALADGSWELAKYSNYGENVNVVAPGTVYTTKMGGGYGGMNGTSFASPITAGVMALYLSQNPYSEFDTVEELLYASCYDLGDLGSDWYYGYGALDVSAMLLEERGTVTFNMMTDELENTMQVFIRDHTLQNMPEPERLYAVFDGWYYEPQCVTEYVLYESKFTSDLTLYAKWVNEEDGVPFTYVELDDGTIEIRSYTGHRKYITVPDFIDGKPVSSIGEFAFAGETMLREVKLPKYLKRIRMSAFKGCSNLVSVAIPDTVTEIGDQAFYDNIRLSALTFGKDSQLVSIGDFAFSGCAKMRTFTVPSKVTTLNATAFFRNTSMIAFDVQIGNTSFTAKNGVLFNQTGSTLVCYPAGLTGSYTIPEHVQNVDDYAFACTRLTGVELSGVESLGAYSFMYGSLKSIVIPDSVLEIGPWAFSLNRDLRSAKLGAGLTKIPSCCFINTQLTSIDIPAGIVSIGADAFSSIGVLEQVNFAPNGNLIYIGDSAFFDSGVVDVEIPASVVTIDKGAFFALYFPNLTSLSFAQGSSLYNIEASAFASQYRLKEVDLPDRLAYLGDYSFFGTGLTTVNIPASVSYFGAGAFASCHSLTDIWVEDANKHYLDIDGVVYNTQKDIIVAYPAGNARTEYTVLEGVTDIGEASFMGSWNLHQVDFASTVITVHKKAFSECINVYSYGLSDVLTYIQEYAFYKNYSLLSMHMPDSLMQIGRFAFAEDRSLYSVTFTDQAKLPRIGFEAFAYCGLQYFRVPPNVSSIAQGAFKGCEYLTSVTFAENSKLESISAYMLDGCSNLQTITFEQGSALTSIQAHGLEGMRKLTSIDFGDAKLTNIDNFAFRFCESLTRFDIPEGVTFLGRYAFYYCTNLSEVTIPTTMDFLGRYAFLGTKDLNVYFASETLPAHLEEDWDYGTRGYYLGVTDVHTEGDWKYAKLASGNVSIIEYHGTATELDLTSLDFGGDIIIIGGSAFAYSTIESILLPDTLQIIQAEAFNHSELKSVSVPASVTFIGREAFANTPIESLTFASDAKLLTIEQSAFENTVDLDAVTIPASVTTMGRAIFKSSGITSLTFADGFAMTEIPEEAFANTKLSSVVIPDSVTLINHNAFREIKELKSVTLGSGEELMIMSNVFYQSGLETVYIPENVGYVGEYAFVALRDLTEFTVSEDNPYYKAVDGLLVSKNGRKLIAVPAGRQGSLTVPEGIEIIGFGAFEDSRLSEIKFLENANILSLGYRAFYNADSITKIHIPASVVAIDYYAFAMCDNLATVTFAEDNNLKGVYEGAFYSCKNLSDIMLPDSIVEISDFAFYGCRKLSEVPVSETTGLKGIYDYAFAYAGFSGDYTMPKTLIDIGPYAFMGNKFTSVTVPDTNYWDLMIGIGAFAECNNLVEITLPFIGASFEDNEISWFGYIFGAGGYEANATYVPESLKKVNISEGITFVGTHAFNELTELEEISLPHSVQMIYVGAFNGTKARYELTNEITCVYYNPYVGAITCEVQSVHIGEGISGHLKLSSLTERIGDMAFVHCSNLVGIDIPGSVTSIGYQAFGDCSALESVTLGNGIQTIDHAAFIGCSKLQSVVVPDSVISLGEGVFQACESLTSAHIPDNFTILPAGTFQGCFSLKNFTIPASVTMIDYGAFEYCQSLESIEISNKITTIGPFAFYGCQSLTSVTIPESVTEISTAAFQGCDKLKSVYVSDLDAWLNISWYGPAFSNGWTLYCNNEPVSKLVIPEGITCIDDGTFYGCVSLTNVVIPDSVTVIGREAFSECDNLIQVHLGSDVETIEEWAFRNCRALQLIYNNSDLELEFGSEQHGDIAYSANQIIDKNGNVHYRNNDADIEYIDTPDGFRFMKEYGTYKLIAYWGTEETVVLPSDFEGQPYRIYRMVGARHVVIPDSMTSVPYDAFYGSTSLQSVTIPAGVTHIESNAFTNCFNLTEVKFAADSQLTVIAFGAFSYCRSLTDIVIPHGVECIENSAFSSCYSLQSITIPESVKYIENSAFDRCDKLETVILSEGVETIGNSAFANCSRLKNLTIPMSLVSIGEQAFAECTNLLSVKIPDSVTYIGANAFSGCDKLTVQISESHPHFLNVDGVVYDKEVTQVVYVFDTVTEICFPKTVTNILLTNQTSIQTITFEEGSMLAQIDYGAFQNCTSLTSIALPAGVTEIGDFAFYGCTSLKNVTIPDGVERIGFAAFGECITLKNVTLPDSVTLIDTVAFTECRSLLSINIPQNVTCIKNATFNACISLQSIILPDSVTTIESSAFSGCSSLQSIILPEGLISIDSQAFYGCSNLLDIVIPDSVKYLGTGVFRNCDKLISVDLPQKLDIQHFDMFDECDNLKCIEIPEGVTSFSFYGCTNLTSVLIPESVTVIQKNAFYNCISLTNVTLPESIASIEEWSFFNCQNLTRINIPEGVLELSQSAFVGCPLYEVYNNSNLQIDFDTFANVQTHVIVDKTGNKIYKDNAEGITYGITEDGFHFAIQDGTYSLIGYLGALETVTLPESINGHPYVISRLLGVKNVIIPDSITSLEYGAFADCASLTSIIIPDSVTSIGTYAFYGCINLTSITIPGSVTSIGYGAFWGCTKLSSVKMMDGVETIGTYAFESCFNLTDIEIPDSVISIGESALSNTAYYNNPDHWENGILYNGKHLLSIAEHVRYPQLKKETICIAGDAFNHSYSMKQVSIGGDHLGVFFGVTNLETLVITEMPNHEVIYYFPGYIPSTLKSIVLTKDVRMALDAFMDITGVTIYVEANEQDVRWDENFPGWNNGNRVVYGGDWISADFYDQNGDLLSSEIFLTHQIIRRPYLEIAEGLEESQVLVGWDVDGDGIADAIPATSTVDIVAYPVIETRASEYVVKFFDADGVTLISKVTLPYGTVIVPPEIEEKMGYTTGGWIGYIGGMTVSGNHTFVLDRVHNGGGHDYDATVWIAPTCNEEGYNKHICKMCGEWYATDHVAALGHDYTVTETPATCTNEGIMVYNCEVCGDSYSETVAPNGHEYVNSLTKKATCTEGGEMLFTCKDCGHQVIEKTALVAHDYQKKTANKDWLDILIQNIDNVFFGYEVDEVYYYECANCNRIQTAEESSSGTSGGAAGIQSAGCMHQSGEWREYIASNCQNAGVAAKFCLACENPVEFKRYESTGAHLASGAVEENRFAPTCTGKGGYDMVVYCSVCGDELIRNHYNIEALGHDMGEWYQTLAPTCTTEGENRCDCGRCDSFDTKVVPANGHAPADVVVENRVEPTCTEVGGYDEVVYCTVCGVELSREHVEILANGHTPADVVVENRVEPTCTEVGGYDEVVYCTVCGVELSREHFEIPANGHAPEDIVVENHVDPTCTEVGGHDEVVYCTVCGGELSREHVEIPANGHTPADVVVENRVEPTCTEVGGYDEVVYCTVCGVELSREHFEIPANGHTPADVVVENRFEPTCTDIGGYDDVVCCTVCDVELSREHIEIPANGHAPADVVVENRVEPTCTEVGGCDEVVYCTVCGVELSREHVEIPANGHAPADVVVENRVEPTCTTDGSYDNVIYCNVCGDELSREHSTIPATGHSHGVVITAPTCTEQGYTTHTCHCGDVYVDSYVDALGHTEVVDEAVAPTCTENGLTDGKHCSVCNEVLVAQEVVPANGHTYESVVTDPTCTEKGYTTHTCHCGDTYVDSEAAALGHTPSDWIVDAEAQIGVNGSKHKECTVCGETLETEVIEALTEVLTTDAPTTEAPTTEVPATDPEPSGGCNGTISVPVVLLVLLSCFVVAWRPRKDN